MFLFIDAGNTRIKYAGHDGRSWVFHAAVPSDGSIPLSLPEDFSPRRVVMVSVASDATNTFIENGLASRAGPIERFRSGSECAGLRNGYARPEQLGADRWAAAAGAWQQVRSACLVVGAGTATTIDVITADGTFAGGCIMPGLEMMQRALARGTAGLPFAAGRFEAVPRSTADAIFSGCLNAQHGAIDRMRRQLPLDAPILLAGGAGGALVSGLEGNVMLAPHLVLEGLYAALGVVAKNL